MNLKEQIDRIQELFMTHPSVQSTGYGEKEAIDLSKKSILYPRTYIHWLEADRDTNYLEIYVVDDIVPEQTNRLDVQSAMLTLGKELIQLLVTDELLPNTLDITYQPTRLHGRNQHEGVYFEIEIALREDIDVCLIVNPVIE